MNQLSASILSAALLATSANATLGIACVDSVLVEVYDYINECRTAATCEAATDFAAGPGASDASSWEMRNLEGSHTYNIDFYGTNGGTLTGQATFMTTLGTYITDNAAMSEMTWAEGLALAADSYTTEWAADTSFTSMTTPTGTTTTSRASANGTVSGSITETAFFYTTYAVDPLDMMRMIIANDSGVLAEAFFSTDASYLEEYLTMGASYALETGCTMESSTPTTCQMVFDVVVASGYTNNSDVAECQPVVSYGGGECDPDASAQAVYEAINTMRLNTDVWGEYLDSASGNTLITFPNSYQLSAEITNADVTAATTSTKSLTLGSSNVGDASTAITNATDLEALEWVGGLAKAAFDQADFLSTSETLTSVGSGDSTFAERLAEYGTAGNDSIELLNGSDMTSDWVVLWALIDDLDSDAAGRTALLSSTVAQAGVMSAASDTFTTVYVIAMDSNFENAADFECEATVVTTVVSGAAGLAVAASAILFSALY